MGTGFRGLGRPRPGAAPVGDLQAPGNGLDAGPHDRDAAGSACSGWPVRALLAAALLVACSSERDYSLTACPARVAAAGDLDEACDRGSGESPRFVTLDACALEVGRNDLAGRPRSYSCSHPNRSVCAVSSGFPRVLCTIDDVIAAPR